MTIKKTVFFIFIVLLSIYSIAVNTEDYVINDTEVGINSGDLYEWIYIEEEDSEQIQRWGLNNTAIDFNGDSLVIYYH